MKNLIFIVLIAPIILLTSCNTLEVEYQIDYSFVHPEVALVDEGNYSQEMQEKVEPFLHSLEENNIFETDDGTDIHYQTFMQENDKGTIIIVHGFSEFAEKFDEVTYYFLKEGYSVARMDNRGHGYSDRETSDLSKVTITDFSTYVDDLHQFIHKIVRTARPDSPLFLYGHSMGGGISAMYLENYPKDIKAGILSSPMMKIELGFPPEWLGAFFAGSAKLFGAGDNYVIGHTPFDGISLYREGSAISEARYQYGFEKRVDNPLFQTWGATYDWLDQAIKATKTIVKNADKATMVDLVFCPGTEHEIYNSSNELLTAYYSTIFKFLDVAQEKISQGSL